MTQVGPGFINRYYYQSRIPMGMPLNFLSQVEDPALRRIWQRRIES